MSTITLMDMPKNTPKIAWKFIAQIQEENEQLKTDLDEQLDINEERSVEYHMFKTAEFDTVRKENKELKEKDKGWTQLMKGAMGSGLVGKVEKLTEENKELKKENEELKEEEELSDNLTDKTYGELMKLKKENKKLKERVGYYSEHNKKLNTDMEESEKYDWKKKFHHLNSRFIALENIEKKLKEKNKGYEALLRCESGVSIERVIEIKKENKKLKADLKLFGEHY